MIGLRVRVMALTALATAIGGATLRAQTPVNPTAATLAEFQKRLDAYVQMRERAVADIPKLKETPTPADIGSREQALGAALRTARASARHGDLVGPADALLRKIVRTDYARRSAAERQALLAEVPRVGRIVINTRYPAGFALATVPPLLLQELPRLPEVLEYRLVGRALILRDVPANIIVDLVDKALPSR
jgi:hypothetical protein